MVCLSGLFLSVCVLGLFVGALFLGSCAFLFFSFPVHIWLFFLSLLGHDMVGCLWCALVLVCVLVVLMYFFGCVGGLLAVVVGSGSCASSYLYVFVSVGLFFGHLAGLLVGRGIGVYL